MATNAAVECNMAGCSKKGDPSHICFRCERVKVFFCWTHEQVLMMDLRKLGKLVINCRDCIGKKAEG